MEYKIDCFFKKPFLSIHFSAIKTICIPTGWKMEESGAIPKDTFL